MPNACDYPAMNELYRRQLQITPETPAPNGWRITSANSGLSWLASKPILEPGNPERLHLNYWQFPV